MVTVIGTTLFTVPGGETAVIEVELLTVKLVAGVAPHITAVTSIKFTPESVTVVPPVNGPEFGASKVMLGNPM